MAKLTTANRNALPASDFGEPAKRAFPMPDASHAANAKSRASQAVNAGRMAPATESRIDAKANKMLGQNRPADPMRTTHNPANRLPLNTRHKPGSRGTM